MLHISHKYVIYLFKIYVVIINHKGSSLLEATILKYIRNTYLCIDKIQLIIKHSFKYLHKNHWCNEFLEIPVIIKTIRCVKNNNNVQSSSVTCILFFTIHLHIV